MLRVAGQMKEVSREKPSLSTWGREPIIFQASRPLCVVALCHSIAVTPRTSSTAALPSRICKAWRRSKRSPTVADPKTCLTSNRSASASASSCQRTFESGGFTSLGGETKYSSSVMVRSSFPSFFVRRVLLSTRAPTSATKAHGLAPVNRRHQLRSPYRMILVSHLTFKALDFDDDPKPDEALLCVRQRGLLLCRRRRLLH